jgi:PAS domain S-box-containing protein
MDAFLIFAAQAMIYAAFPFYFATLRPSFRFIFFYVYISIILVVGGFLGAVYSFPLADTINISGGSLAYGALIMSTLLLFIMERDLNVIRNVIRIVIVVNVFKFFVFSMISWALGSNVILNPFNTSPSVFSVSIWIVILGGALIISELLLLIFLFEKIKMRSKDVNLLSVFYTIFFICILCLDGILFPLIASPLDPELVNIIIGGVKGKFVMGLIYSIPIIIFLFVFRKNIEQYNITPIRLQELLFEPKETLIQEIERQHQALEAGEENYRHLAESIGDIFFSMDADMRFTYWNRASEAATGHTREEALGKTLYELFPQTIGTPLEEFYKNVLITQRSGHFINQMQVDGQKRYYEISAYPFRGGVSVLAHDITERKRAEEELRRLNEELEQRVAERTDELAAALIRAQDSDRLKSAFLATMSHELRTPLNSIIGFTGIILQGLAGPLNEEQTKQLNMTRQSAHHLLALINDVLDISKIEAGQLEIIKQPFDMRQAVESALRVVLPLAKKKKLQLETSMGASVGIINNDRRRVEQVLINLVNNAIKFTERGEVSIACQIRDGWLETSVSDHGIGIKAEDIDQLFKPFQQIDTGPARGHEGTGLGLAISKRLVTAMGGEITVESQWGVGSTFKFTLPS